MINVSLVLAAMLVILAVLILFCIIRSVIGPKNTDRVVAINMIGSIGNALIAGLATYYKQNFLADVAILYSMLSFTAVVVMSRIMRGVHHEQLEKPEEEDANE